MSEIYRRDTSYWNNYYSLKNKSIVEHSLFAEFIMGYLKSECELLEIGCGNGRDSRWFADNGIHVSCIDASDVAINCINEGNTKIDNAICGDFVNNDLYSTKCFDAVYSRFSVHAIDEMQEAILFDNVYKCLNDEGIFAIEVRSIHDELYRKGVCVGRDAYLYENHYRRFIEINELIRKLIKVGFIVQYAEENINFAPFDNSNPRIIRVVVKKRKEKNIDNIKYFVEKYDKIFLYDGDDIEFIHRLIGIIRERKLKEYLVIGTPSISCNNDLYYAMDEQQFESLGTLFNTYDFSDKVICIGDGTINGNLLNYLKNGIISEVEYIESLLA